MNNTYFLENYMKNRQREIEQEVTASHRVYQNDSNRCYCLIRWLYLLFFNNKQNQSDKANLSMFQNFCERKTG
jgi:hypothetical protein